MRHCGTLMDLSDEFPYNEDLHTIIWDLDHEAKFYIKEKLHSFIECDEIFEHEDVFPEYLIGCITNEEGLDRYVFRDFYRVLFNKYDINITENDVKAILKDDSILKEIKDFTDLDDVFEFLTLDQILDLYNYRTIHTTARILKEIMTIVDLQGRNTDKLPTNEDGCTRYLHAILDRNNYTAKFEEEGRIANQIPDIFLSDEKIVIKVKRAVNKSNIASTFDRAIGQYLRYDNDVILVVFTNTLKLALRFH